MKSLNIDPVDVWLFRDGRPFDADSGHRAVSMFPPLPTVVQGMLRTAHLVHKGIDLNDSAAIRAAVGDSKDFGGLRLRGPFLRRAQTALFALPADVYKSEDGNFCTLDVRDRDTLSGHREFVSTDSGQTHAFLPPHRARPQKIEETLVDQKAFDDYLALRPFSADRSGGLWQSEPRMGNGIDSARQTTIEGRLFQVEFKRPVEGVGLYLELAAGLWADEPNMPGFRAPFGGERRVASVGPGILAKPLPSKVISSRLFKVIFLTPTYFGGGWQPANGDWSQHFQVSGNGQLTLLAAAVPKALCVGGFDMHGQVHKPSFRYVPAGSVYVFKAPADARVLARHDWICDAADGVELGHIGFGQFAAGDATAQVTA
jgi:CRISPR-associated protein Cmr3